MGEKANSVRRFIRFSLINTIWLSSSYGKLKRLLANKDITEVRPYKFARWHSGFNYFLGKWQGRAVFVKTCVGKYDTTLSEAAIETYSDNKHIPRVICHDGGKLPYIVTEFLDIRSIDSTKDGDIKSVVKQCCEILDYMYENKIIHRDIRPENMAVTDDGTVVLIDFGWAVYGANEYKVSQYDFIESILNADYRNDGKFDDAYAMLETLKHIYDGVDVNVFEEIEKRVGRLVI